MIIDYANDGEEFDKDRLIDEGFILQERRDFRKNYVTDTNSGEDTEGHAYVLNFVGFIINSNHEVFSVFPKNYRVEELNRDSAQLFRLIVKHRQVRPDLYFGTEYGKRFKTDYPFAAFFGIYDYLDKYGLYFEDKIHIKPNIGGKVNWKETVRLSNKYISNGKLNLFPIYYEKKYYFSEFLTECMIFAIDYTIDKFGVFIDLNKTGKAFPNFNFLGEKEIVLENLFSLRQQTFKDSLLELIDHLINFFADLNEGGSYYFKHYSFSSIWEDMVMSYLKSNYKEIKNEKIVFDEENLNQIEFSKVSFRPNIANKDHYFTPDYYYGEGDTQLIFDAKYYTNTRGMDYKQIAYYLFLNEYREDINNTPKFSNTYSALLLPSESRSSKIHFKMDPRFNKSNQSLVISEEYLDIREVINFYL
ncbi:hypothetical protein J2Z83_003485 [Virgibacillus natechei]|uniref:LlaJI family restriction endonuclease n=1 Tax=Virgibacillus natechei TaxID=1216297 RepID=A0ABS4IM22_9BACI|nr:hypothetical protein [Virgibacillus natechei]MBP1971346.1 hypothetical protein [Virgibacillus natechei]UZD12919.1 hypothetical protein OLD84_18885 [Virgibacillus natechei]